MLVLPKTVTGRMITITKVLKDRKKYVNLTIAEATKVMAVLKAIFENPESAPSIAADIRLNEDRAVTIITSRAGPNSLLFFDIVVKTFPNPRQYRFSMPVFKASSLVVAISNFLDLDYCRRLKHAGTGNWTKDVFCENVAAIVMLHETKKLMTEDSCGDLVVTQVKNGAQICPNINGEILMSARFLKALNTLLEHDTVDRLMYMMGHALVGDLTKFDKERLREIACSLSFSIFKGHTHNMLKLMNALKCLMNPENDNQFTVPTPSRFD